MCQQRLNGAKVRMAAHQTYGTAYLAPELTLTTSSKFITKIILGQKDLPFGMLC